MWTLHSILVHCFYRFFIVLKGGAGDDNLTVKADKEMYPVNWISGLDLETIRNQPMVVQNGIVKLDQKKL